MKQRVGRGNAPKEFQELRFRRLKSQVLRSLEKECVRMQSCPTGGGNLQPGMCGFAENRRGKVLRLVSGQYSGALTFQGSDLRFHSGDFCRFGSVARRFYAKRPTDDGEQHQHLAEILGWSFHTCAVFLSIETPGKRWGFTFSRCLSKDNLLGLRMPCG